MPSRRANVVGLFSAALLTITSSSLLASPAPPELTVSKSYGKIAGWSIGFSDSLGGCVAAATYHDQTTIWFGFGGVQDRAYLAFTNPKWRSIDVGDTYTIVMNAHNRGRWHGTFVGFDRSGERGLFASGLKDRFVSDLSNSEELDVEFSGKRIAAISLVGSTEALAVVNECQRALVAGKLPSDRASQASKEDDDEAHSSQGTGFYVSASGLVLTNNHVIDGCKDINITRNGLPSIKAHLVAHDERNDLALLGTDVHQATVPALSRARIGETIFVYGFPLNGLLATSGNFTIGNVTATAGLADDTRQIQISAPVQPGNSGGPLVDQYGDVVGIIVAKLNALKMASVTSDLPQNVNFAIKAIIAQNFLEANGIEARTDARSSSPMDAETIASKAKDFTVRINCH
jgi:S1-C subfamily serine protease